MSGTCTYPPCILDESFSGSDLPSGQEGGPLRAKMVPLCQREEEVVRKEGRRRRSKTTRGEKKGRVKGGERTRGKRREEEGSNGGGDRRLLSPLTVGGRRRSDSRVTGTRGRDPRGEGRLGQLFRGRPKPSPKTNRPRRLRSCLFRDTGKAGPGFPAGTNKFSGQSID